MLRLNIHNLGDVTVFRCAGRITADVRNTLREAVMSRPPARIAVLDLAEVTAVDAAGLGALVSLQKWARANGTRLKLMNLVPRVDEVLVLTNLRSAFEVCSVKDMLDLLCRATSQPRFATADAPPQWSFGRA
jgi:anti-anti-sigma factor